VRAICILRAQRAFFAAARPLKLTVSWTMDHQAAVAVVKLTASAAVAIALLLVWRFGGDSWFRPVAAVSFVVVAAPVALLVAIDSGRVLRRYRLGRAATIATRVPQLLMGAFACVGAVGGVGLAIFGDFPAQWQRVGCALVSIAALVYGISLLRNEVRGTKGNVSS
jgi:hypothetical protein